MTPDLSRLRDVQTWSISPEDFDGAKGGGGRAEEGTGARPARDRGAPGRLLRQRVGRVQPGVVGDGRRQSARRLQLLLADALSGRGPPHRGEPAVGEGHALLPGHLRDRRRPVRDEFPTIAGTGTEDYFGGAWNFDIPGAGYTAYSTPYLGLPQILRPDGLYDSQQRFGMYRWHVLDPIHFHTDLRVDIQALGWKAGWRYNPLRDDIASTALFYLDRPSASRPEFPGVDDLAHPGDPTKPN